MTPHSQRPGTATTPRFDPTSSPRLTPLVSTPAGSLRTFAKRHFAPSRIHVPCRECDGHGTVRVIHLPPTLWWVLGSAVLVAALLFGSLF